MLWSPCHEASGQQCLTQLTAPFLDTRPSPTDLVLGCLSFLVLLLPVGTPQSPLLMDKLNVGEPQGLVLYLPTFPSNTLFLADPIKSHCSKYHPNPDDTYVLASAPNFSDFQAHKCQTISPRELHVEVIERPQANMPMTELFTGPSLTLYSSPILINGTSVQPLFKTEPKSLMVSPLLLSIAVTRS